MTHTIGLRRAKRPHIICHREATIHHICARTSSIDYTIYHLSYMRYKCTRESRHETRCANIRGSGPYTRDDLISHLLSRRENISYRREARIHNLLYKLQSIFDTFGEILYNLLETTSSRIDHTTERVYNLSCRRSQLASIRGHLESMRSYITYTVPSVTCFVASTSENI